MKRKVIQLTVLPEGERVNAAILALCDDGTMWRFGLSRDMTHSWTNIPGPPEE